jgi:hypothetical protein
MKVGDRVKLVRPVLLHDPRATGEITRFHSGSSRVSVRWQLNNGGVLCQAEDLTQLQLVSKPDLA